MSVTTGILIAQLVATSAALPAVPFEVGETFIYKAKFGFITAGGATLKVEGVESTRGIKSWKFSMQSNTSVPGFKNTLHLTSWTSVDSFISLRFLKVNSDSSASRQGTENFNIYPDSGFFRRGADTGQKATPKDPLDDVAFIYYLRLRPLKVGDSLVIPRYYRSNIRDLSVRVSGTETLELPDGRKVECLILHPVVDQQPNGMFRKQAQARLWLSNDPQRIPVKIESRYSFGKITLQLDKMILK